MVCNEKMTLRDPAEEKVNIGKQYSMCFRQSQSADPRELAWEEAFIKPAASWLFDPWRRKSSEFFEASSFFQTWSLTNWV